MIRSIAHQNDSVGGTPICIHDVCSCTSCTYYKFTGVDLLDYGQKRNQKFCLI